MKLKTKDVLMVYNVLGSAKYGKMEDADKIKMWKIARAMRPVAQRFEEDSKDAAEKLKPENYDDDLARAQSYERTLKNPNLVGEQKMGPAEYGEFLKTMRNYRKTVDDALKEYAEKEVDLNFNTISEDVFSKLMSANDWTLDQVAAIDIITA